MVETTLGLLSPSGLGRIDAHEHVIIDGGLMTVKHPEFKLDSVEKAVEEVGRWKAAGGGAIVDTIPIGAGRQVDQLVQVSRETGVPILVPTGFHSISNYLPDHWQHRYSEEQIAELMLAECIEGLDRGAYDGPLVERSPVKAGLLKVAAGYHHISPTTAKIIRAAGRVHARCAVPMLVHTEMGTAGDEILDAFESVGVPPSRVLLSHIDRNPDATIHLRLARRGAFLQYDTPIRVQVQPESVVVELMRTVIQAGLGDRLCLGGDLARRSYWRAYGGGPGLDYLLTTFTARLEEEGFVEGELDAIWHGNPARWLTGAAA